MSRKTVVEGLHIEIEPDGYFGRWNDFERRERLLNEWAREFQAFVRDHRSQDRVTLTVKRDYRNECEHCGEVWTESSASYNGGCCEKDQEAHDAAQPEGVAA